MATTKQCKSSILSNVILNAKDLIFGKSEVFFSLFEICIKGMKSVFPTINEALKRTNYIMMMYIFSSNDKKTLIIHHIL